jgi:predicted ATPase/DNA-binding SARP family transcriptional activator
MTAVGVLGPLLLVGPDGPVRVGSLRQRRLLAALVAHLGRATPADLVAELVWSGDDQPADPAGAVQTNVARLRRLLPGEVRIATEPDGYRLLVDPRSVDVSVFTEQLATAERTSDPLQRLSRLDDALALWRGAPYAELDHPSIAPEVARLSELRAGAAEQRAETLLALGRTSEAIAALEAITRAEPLREDAVGLLMRALVAAGRQGDALAAFAALRARLADELGIDPAPRLRELEQQVLRQQLPNPAPPSRPVPALALPVSSFLGRGSDVAAIGELLTTRRIVTLCGPGGVGKTRLARHAAAAVADRYDDGVLVVEFGDGGRADVEPALAAALRLSDGAPSGDGSVAERIVEVLAVRRLLLVLDNCEHVADEVAAFAEAIAVGTPAVDLLLTSREPLRVDGEYVYAVEPLAPPAAARLLLDRLDAAGGRPEPNRDALVTELCERLDRLPLALELAAARARALGVDGLLAALDATDHGPVEVLRGGRRTAAERHRSLREVVAWSYGLLDDRQRALFEQMSVFAGPVEQAAVTAVCADATALPDLVDRSLVVRTPDSPTRFGMLETLRAYGRSRLASRADVRALRKRHARWATELAEEIRTLRRGPYEGAAVRSFDAHLADLRRAHAWMCEAGPADDLLRLSLIFGELAHLRGRIDLVRLVEQALDAANHPPCPLTARLVGLLAMSSWQRGDLAAAEEQARRAIAIAESSDEVSAARDGYEALANVLFFRGEPTDDVRSAQLRALDLAEAAGDIECQVLALVDLVIVNAYAGDDAAAARYETALAGLTGQLRSPTTQAWLAYARGERRAESGSPDAARYLQQAVQLADQVDSSFVAGIARHTLLTATARSSGDERAALAGFGPLIDHWHRYGAWTQLWIAARALIETLSRFGRHRDVALLIGALGASPRASPPSGADAARLQAVERAAQYALGPEFDALRVEGSAMGDAGAVALARRVTRGARRGAGGSEEPSDGAERFGASGMTAL